MKGRQTVCTSASSRAIHWLIMSHRCLHCCEQCSKIARAHIHLAARNGNHCSYCGGITVYGSPYEKMKRYVEKRIPPMPHLRLKYTAATLAVKALMNGTFKYYAHRVTVAETAGKKGQSGRQWESRKSQKINALLSEWCERNKNRNQTRCKQTQRRWKRESNTRKMVFNWNKCCWMQRPNRKTASILGVHCLIQAHIARRSDSHHFSFTVCVSVIYATAERPATEVTHEPKCERTTQTAGKIIINTNSKKQKTEIKTKTKNTKLERFKWKERMGHSKQKMNTNESITRMLVRICYG